jgi:twinkle protein
VVGVARYCAKELGMQHIFIDSLMKVVPDEDDHNGQKRFVDELTAIARDYGTHVHLISHIRKLSNEEVAPGKHDVKGTGAITDLVDNLLLVYRNKKKENAKETGGAWSEADPDTFLICAKQRNGEWEGRIGLWFDPHSQQFVHAFGAAPLNFCRFPHRSHE